MNTFGKKALNLLKESLCDLGFEVELLTEEDVILTSGEFYLKVSLKYRTELWVGVVPGCDLLEYDKRIDIIPYKEKSGHIQPLFLEGENTYPEIGAKCAVGPETMALYLVEEINELLQEEKGKAIELKRALDSVEIGEHKGRGAEETGNIYV